jgi:NADH-quinone oxidoreductase subunit D
MQDVDEVWIRQVRDFVKGFPQAHADVARLLNRNRIFIDRLRGIGVLSREDAINWSCTGPIARASGVVRDLRKDEPYLAYSDFDFKVICAQTGDSFARYLVRMDEMLESIKIIQQAIENLPPGPVNVDINLKDTLPDKSATYRSIEGLIQHFELIMTNRLWKTPVDEVYGATESPNGELGFYIVADGSGRAYRARTRPPSYIHFSIFPLLIVGHQVSDIVAVLGSLNIIAAELDR